MDLARNLIGRINVNVVRSGHVSHYEDEEG